MNTVKILLLVLITLWIGLCVGFSVGMKMSDRDWVKICGETT